MDPLDTMLRQIKPQVLGWMASWHAQQGYLLPFSAHDYVSNQISVVGSPYSTTAPGAVVLISWEQTGQVITTNNSSNYWTIALYRSVTGVSIKLSEINTSRWALGTWTKESITVGGGILSTDKLLYIYVAKVGSPGALSLAGPMVRVK